MIRGEPSGATPFQGTPDSGMGTRAMPFSTTMRSFLRVAMETRSISGPSGPKSSKYEYLLSADQLGYCSTLPVANSDHLPVLTSRSICFFVSAEKKEMYCPSGDQRGPSIPSVPAMGVNFLV